MLVDKKKGTIKYCRPANNIITERPSIGPSLANRFRSYIRWVQLAFEMIIRCPLLEIYFAVCASRRTFLQSLKVNLYFASVYAHCIISLPLRDRLACRWTHTSYMGIIMLIALWISLHSSHYESVEVNLLISRNLAAILWPVWAFMMGKKPARYMII